MKLAIVIILTLNIGIAGIVFLGEGGTKSVLASTTEHGPALVSTPEAFVFHSDYMPVQDTIWVLGNAFLMVDLEGQHMHLHQRGVDTLISIPISSGNPRIHDGMETPTGIYSVQSKSPLAISRQYDNAKMFHWIGFNYNIGAHGLEGSGYYRHLGTRPSSHGCLRVGREDIERLFPLVRHGTPVMVHRSRPARAFAFVDSAAFHAGAAVRLESRSKPMTKYMQQRLERLYSGRTQIDYMPEVYLDGETQLRPGGYPVGSLDSVAIQTKAIIVNHDHIHAGMDLDQLTWRSKFLCDSLTRGLHVAVRFRTEETPGRSLSTAQTPAL